jgi:glycosyltransferase involved in cell wall biosynthesis
MPHRRILLVAQIAPPSPLSAARRVAGLARHLFRLGHEVTVLTSMLSGRGPIDGAVRTVRTRDLLASGLNWRRGNFAALEGNDPAADYARPSRVATLLVPDPAVVSWLPFALPRALRLAAGADCVITSAPARSTHLLGLATARRGAPWVADFRDGWRFEDQRDEWAHPLLDRIDEALERAVVRGAQACVGVTDPITQDLRDRLGVAHAETITNGFDRDDADLTASATPPLESNGRHTVVHTGSLAYGGRDPRPVVEALRLLRREDPAAAERLCVLFAGPVSEDERAAIEAPDVRSQVRALGALPRAAALALQRSAGTLLLITGDEQVSIATGKLYEYFATGRPILVLGERSEAARLVREANAGVAIPAGDPRAIAGALRDRLHAPEAAVTPADVERFSYARIAEQVADVVERAISASAAR